MTRYIWMIIVLVFSMKKSIGQSSKSSSIDSLVHEIAQANVYENSATIGYSGAPSQQNIRYQAIVSLCDSTQILSAFEKEKNPVAKVYLYRALIAKKQSIPKEIIKRMKSNNERIKVINGCHYDYKTMKYFIENEWLLHY